MSELKISLILISVVLLSSCAGLERIVKATDKYSIVQITDNDYPDVGVEIYGSKLAWQAVPEGSSDTEIYYYDGKYAHRLTFNDTYDCTPAISSGGITWQSYRTGGGSDVFFFDFNAIKRITDDAADDYRPAIYDDKVVWCKHERVDGQIMMYEKGEVTSIEGTHAVFPRISSSGIMYSNVRDNHLYIYDWSNIIDLGDIGIEYTQNAHNQQINGDKIVWRKYIDGYHEVFLHDISDGITRQVTDKEINPEREVNPKTGDYCQVSVRGNYITWRSYQDEINYLRLYDDGQILTIASAPKMDNPFFGEGFLVWAMGKDSVDMEVFVYSLTSKEITRITNNSFPDRYPIASNEYIAWQKNDRGNYEIYLAHISSH